MNSAHVGIGAELENSSRTAASSARRLHNGQVPLSPQVFCPPGAMSLTMHNMPVLYANPTWVFAYDSGPRKACGPIVKAQGMQAETCWGWVTNSKQLVLSQAGMSRIANPQDSK